MSRSRPAASEAPSAAPDVAATPRPLLQVRDLEVVYDDVVLVLRGVSLDVPAGSIVALLGANGAGKTTLLRAITGLLGLHRGAVTKGEVLLDGEPVTGRSAPALVRRGVSQVMEGRRVFATMSVEDNLRSGGLTRSRSESREAYDRVLELFPRLAERRTATAGYLSGGEQQMVAIGRAMMASPRLLLLDEPSLGLAPQIVEQIRDIVVALNADGTTVLLVEQNATMALSIASHGTVLETGRVVKTGPAADLLGDRDIQEFYLGIGGASADGEAPARRSFRDVKSYRRRKGWSA